MDFTMDDALEIIEIVRKYKDVELHLDTGDLQISLFRGDVGDRARQSMGFSGTACQSVQAGPKAAPAAPAAATTEVAAEPKTVEAPPMKAIAEEASEEGLVPIKASVTSVFYRRPNPDEPPFVEVGDEVKEDSVLCLLEVMKCFRQVMADVRGRVEKICVESNTLVNEGTILFLIRPR